jgi:hypothetical protein
MKCLICDSHEASQVRAHIFPAWMIASAFDPENRTRNYEIMCAMYPFGTKLPYFGNSVQPEKIKELIGRDLTDKEISEQENYATVINLWCTGKNGQNDHLRPEQTDHPSPDQIDHPKPEQIDHPFPTCFFIMIY